MRNAAVLQWVNEMTRLTRPERVVWLNGSEQEYEELLATGVSSGQLIPLNPRIHPQSYLHRSHPKDTARTEQCTYVCPANKDDAGPTNNWMAPEAAYATLYRLLDGAMHGRTMYVIPYLMGPPGSAFSRVGIELTDSVYVAVNMRIMTRMGTAALEHLKDSAVFVKGMHSLGTLDPEQRYICHFPEDLAIYSVNSGYGGNALLGKKCMALRLGSWWGRREGWLAEHMLIVGIEDPAGRVTYVAGAFPSACGKTNLAMLRPAEAFRGYRVWVVGDDIAWLRVGADGRLYAVNPETGFFGVAPGTNQKTNPNMMATITRKTIFTNAALAPDQSVWWEGLDRPSDTSGFVDWQGRPWDPRSGQPAAHPNSRFTVPITQCPVLAPAWDDPQGVPISAILFGARRSTLMPLVYEAFTWQHGVYLGATLSSETTTAATGATGVLRMDPMAMVPFCGYNMGDYFAHWLDIGKRLTRPPKVFRVNWFRVNGQGSFLWPGFGENIRVLKWILDRCDGKAGAMETPIGYLPSVDSLNPDELSLSGEDCRLLLSIDRDGWLNDTKRYSEFLAKFGDRIPAPLLDEHAALVNRLKSWDETASCAASGTPAPRAAPVL